MTPAPTAEAHAAFVVDKRRDHGHAPPSPPRPNNVNVVKPLQLGDDAPATPASSSILDPKFSRALDFKLRRLKEKEILQTNLRRPTRYRPRNGALAASDPDVRASQPSLPGGPMSRSDLRLDEVESGSDRKISPTAEKSPERRMRSRNAAPPLDADKPRFVTTVRSGQFLLPPPEIARVLGLDTLYPPHEKEKVVYSYSSKPKVLASRSKRSPPDRRQKQEEGGAPASVGGDGAARGVAQLFGSVRALVGGVAGLATLTTHHHGAGGANGYTNVMHDKRVVRGSTLASHPLAAGDGVESAAAGAARTRRRALARRAAAAAARLRPGTPPPAPGRRHLPVQTDLYLEELWDKRAELEASVQTEAWRERPASPRYVPAKTGADKHTQLYPGDLFDFDLEVQPVLEVLVGKTTEQALAEVAQEEELAVLREQQRRYYELRDAELAERQRLAAHDARLHREKERRVAEAREAQRAGLQARERAAAAVLVQGYVAELLPAVLAGLRDQGYLLHTLHTGVDEEFMPWLVEEVSVEMESLITSRDVIIEIVRDVVEARAELYARAAERDAARAPSCDSLTPRSLPGEGEGEEEGDHLDE